MQRTIVQVLRTDYCKTHDENTVTVRSVAIVPIIYIYIYEK